MGMGTDRGMAMGNEQAGSDPERPGEALPQVAATPSPLDAAAGCISLEAEVPEVLFDGMREFISSHPHWDQYSVITSALAGFLFQNGCSDSSVSQHYLDGLFLRP
jgi:hypothetical protein